MCIPLYYLLAIPPFCCVCSYLYCSFISRSLSPYFKFCSEFPLPSLCICRFLQYGRMYQCLKRDIHFFYNLQVASLPFDAISVTNWYTRFCLPSVQVFIKLVWLEVKGIDSHFLWITKNSDWLKLIGIENWLNFIIILS